MDLGKIVKNKNGNIIFTNEPKLAKIYGVELMNGYKVKNSVLLVADRNKIITDIYKDACEDDIVELIHQLD